MCACVYIDMHTKKMYIYNFIYIYINTSNQVIYKYSHILYSKLQYIHIQTYIYFDIMYICMSYKYIYTHLYVSYIEKNTMIGPTVASFSRILENVTNFTKILQGLDSS